MNMKVLQLIDKELESAKARYPWWPSDAVHAGAIVAEEAGELTQATLDHVYDHLNHNGADTVARMRKEAVQTAAMAVRFLENMEAYTDPGRRVKADTDDSQQNVMEIRTRFHEIKPDARRSSFVCGESVSHSEMVDYIWGDAREVDDDLK